MSYNKKHQGQKRGTPMAGLDVTPERRKREAKRRKKHEERWAAKSGPVTSYIAPSVVKPKAESESPAGETNTTRSGGCPPCAIHTSVGDEAGRGTSKPVIPRRRSRPRAILDLSAPEALPVALGAA